jgi:hypothetical protein
MTHLLDRDWSSDHYQRSVSSGKAGIRTRHSCLSLFRDLYALTISMLLDGSKTCVSGWLSCA